jgi:hypothetical protein
MAALDFPASPTVGQLYPTPAVPGVPVYKWDGEKWTTLGGALGSTGASDAIPQQDAGSGAAGSSTLWTRGDHAHPVDPSIATKVAKAGDTMTGNLAVTANQPQIVLNKNAGGVGAYFGGYTNNKPRWFIEVGDAAAETGGNAGSNLSFDRYTDAGAYIDSPFYLTRSTGNVSMPGSVTAGNIASSGNVFGAFIRASGNVQADNGIVYGLGGGNYITSDANITTMLVSGVNCYWSYVKATGRWDWIVNSAAQMSLLNGGLFYAFGQGYKPGGGAWADSSDARIKTIKGAYTTGLDAIAALNPVTFSYKGNDTSEPPDHVPSADGSKSKDAVSVPYPNSPHRQVAETGKTFHGMIAQEVEQVMPELVTQRPGYIDGVAVTDLRDIDSTPLIFALVNAIKELKLRVEMLEAA